MKRLLILSVFVFVAVGQDIEHAPTVAQCQADQRLWLSEIEANDKDSSVQLPDMSVLHQWLREMNNCITVDPENKTRYYNTVGEIDAEMLLRTESFIRRHALWSKFMGEDAAGKR